MFCLEYYRIDRPPAGCVGSPGALEICERACLKVKSESTNEIAATLEMSGDQRQSGRRNV